MNLTTVAVHIVYKWLLIVFNLWSLIMPMQAWFFVSFFFFFSALEMMLKDINTFVTDLGKGEKKRKGR